MPRFTTAAINSTIAADAAVDRAQFGDHIDIRRQEDDQSHNDQEINTTCTQHHDQSSSMAVLNVSHRSISFVMNSVLHFASSSVSSLMDRARNLSRQALSAVIYTPLRILPNRVGSAICRIGIVRDYYCFDGSRCSTQNMDNCLKDELLRSLDHVETARDGTV